MQQIYQELKEHGEALLAQARAGVRHTIEQFEELVLRIERIGEHILARADVPATAITGEAASGASTAGSTGGSADGPATANADAAAADAGAPSSDAASSGAEAGSQATDTGAAAAS